MPLYQLEHRKTKYDCNKIILEDNTNISAKPGIFWKNLKSGLQNSLLIGIWPALLVLESICDAGPITLEITRASIANNPNTFVRTAVQKAKNREMSSVLQCYNKGCGQKYDPKENKEGRLRMCLKY